MTAMRSSLPLAAMGAGLLSVAPACTALVVQDALAGAVACETAGDCAAGFACQDGRCEAVEPSGQTPPEGTLVGPGGGDVLGPDGVELAVPPDAVGADTAFIIKRESATNVALGCDEASGFFRVTPAVVLAEPAVLSIPVLDCAECAVCAKPGEDGSAWIVLEEPPVTPTGVAAALLGATGGIVVAGVAQ